MELCSPVSREPLFVLRGKAKIRPRISKERGPPAQLYQRKKGGKREEKRKKGL
jgi:hypothetical protein